jgi:hypothetical protein
VSVRSSLTHNGAAKVQVTNDAARSKIKVLLDNFRQISIRHTLFHSAVRVNKDTEWVRNTDRITELNKSTSAQFVCDKTFRNPTGSVGTRTINLCVVLSRKGATSMRAPSTIGINDDFTKRDRSHNRVSK